MFGHMRDLFLRAVPDLLKVEENEGITSSSASNGPIVIETQKKTGYQDTMHLNALMDPQNPQPGLTQPDPTLKSPALVEGFGRLRAQAQAIESPSPGQFWKCPNISFLEDVQSLAKSPSPARPKPDPEAGFGGLRARAHTLLRIFRDCSNVRFHLRSLTVEDFGVHLPVWTSGCMPIDITLQTACVTVEYRFCMSPAFLGDVRRDGEIVSLWVCNRLFCLLWRSPLRRRWWKDAHTVGRMEDDGSSSRFMIELIGFAQSRADFVFCVESDGL
ncbi:hypothetical protein EDD85DRAFT_797439 [Armillaria nabsnona]|nr:hypothetical protein EDD85DRAFT_797439 [Armillaria nabsnona]